MGCTANSTSLSWTKMRIIKGAVVADLVDHMLCSETSHADDNYISYE
jgi:hypothetical protein